MISIVIPLYNKASRIEKTLESVFKQTFTDYEIVIVNDGSTDGSDKIVESINDSRIRLINQPNGGVSAARNRGIQEARGELVAFLDADDEWLPEYLEKQHSLSQTFKDCDVFATDYLFQKPNGYTSRTILNKMRIVGECGVLDNYFEVGSCSNPPLWTSAVVVRKSAIQAIGGFPIGIKSGEDLLTWARLAARYKIAYSRQPLAIFNVEGYDVKDKPKRVPAEDDVVGRELRVLAKECNPPHIQSYIAFWHKMRSVIYLRLGMISKGRKDAWIGIKSNPTNLKLWALLMLNCMPEFLLKRILNR